MFEVGDSSAEGLVCKNNRLRTVQSKTVYDIKNCGNTEIELGDQNARASLNYIEADKNQISRISDDTFKWAKELTHIDLRENKIEEISVGAFKDQGKLTGLYLKQNELTRIEIGTFDSLTELKELWLQNNQLSLIEKGLFNKNTKLEYLFLSENQIVAIEPTVFQNLNQQVFIRLVGNLCSNENFRGNQFDQNFPCFKSYESLKPHLNENLVAKLNELTHCETAKSTVNREKINLAGKLRSSELELSKTLGEKSSYLAEKDYKDKALKEMLNQLSNINNILNDCQRENITMYQARENLIEQLQICESKESPKSTNDFNTKFDKNETEISLNFWIVVGTLGLIILILLIAFLRSIVNNRRLLDDNKDLKAKLDKLCVDHVYEKVD
jgi:Leucine-rich repeat (LRR) protein